MRDHRHSDNTRHNDNTTGLPARSFRRAWPGPAPLLCASLSLCVLLAGCGGGGSNSAPAPAPAPLAVSAVTPSGLTVTLAESAATVPVGGAVTYTMTFTNNTAQAITFVSNGAVISTGGPLVNGAVSLGNSIVFPGGYFQILNAAGQTVYPPPVTGGTTSSFVGGLPATLGAGQSTSATFAPSGVFTAAGRYTATAPVTLTVGTSGAGTTTTLGPLAVIAQ